MPISPVGRISLLIRQGLVAGRRWIHHLAVMIPKSPLDDPVNAAFAWARFRRLMRWMMLVTVALVFGSLYVLYRSNGAVSVHLYIAAALGIGLTMLLMSALMGLVFLSSGTGHDDAIINPLDEEQDF